MAIRVAGPTMALASVLFLALGQYAFAQGAGNAPAGSGNTSGRAVRTDVQPSTAIQKDQTGRSSEGGGDASNAAGAPILAIGTVNNGVWIISEVLIANPLIGAEQTYLVRDCLAHEGFQLAA
jgi:hypothetical protein